MKISDFLSSLSLPLFSGLISTRDVAFAKKLFVDCCRENFHASFSMLNCHLSPQHPEWIKSIWQHGKKQEGRKKRINASLTLSRIWKKGIRAFVFRKINLFRVCWQKRRVEHKKGDAAKWMGMGMKRWDCNYERSLKLKLKIAMVEDENLAWNLEIFSKFQIFWDDRGGNFPHPSKIHSWTIHFRQNRVG